LRHSLCDISKIEYEHYSTFGSRHKEDSRSCKQTKRRKQEQVKALPDAWKDLNTSTETGRFIFTRSQRRKKRRSDSQNKRDVEDQRFNKNQRKGELVFNTGMVMDSKSLRT
jgi:hypothetical protein